jgi:hypothetical protein
MHILYLKQPNGTLSFLNNDEIFVANLSKECIMSEYRALKLHAQNTAKRNKDIQIKNLMDIIPDLATQITSFL